MKCIKSIKPTKNTEIGVITKITDSEAELKVKSGYWNYVPKSEYKTWKATGNKNNSQTEESNKQLKIKKKSDGKKLN